MLSLAKRNCILLKQFIFRIQFSYIHLIIETCFTNIFVRKFNTICHHRPYWCNSFSPTIYSYLFIIQLHSLWIDWVFLVWLRISGKAAGNYWFICAVFNFRYVCALLIGILLNRYFSEKTKCKCWHSEKAWVLKAKKPFVASTASNLLAKLSTLTDCRLHMAPCANANYDRIRKEKCNFELIGKFSCCGGVY